MEQILNKLSEIETTARRIMEDLWQADYICFEN